MTTISEAHTDVQREMQQLVALGCVRKPSRAAPNVRAREGSRGILSYFDGARLTTRAAPEVCGHALARVYHPKACKRLAGLHFAWWERHAGV